MLSWHAPGRRSGDGAGDADPPPVLVELPLLLVEVGALRVNVAHQLLVTLVYDLQSKISFHFLEITW